MAHLLKTRVASPRGRSSPGTSADDEALKDLEAVFKGMDILGEGRLDVAAFTVALKAMAVTLPPAEVESIFEQLDHDETGFIEYKQFLTFMKMGKIPSSLLNRVKKSSAAPRRSIFFGGAAASASLAMGPKASSGATTGGLLPVGELDRIQREKELLGEDSSEDEEELSPERLKMVNRALIVIKKSLAKKLPRRDVEKFLLDKGMSTEDVKIAWKRAERDAFTPVERLAGMKRELLKKTEELDKEREMNRHLTRAMTDQAHDVEFTRYLLGVCVDLLESRLEVSFDTVEVPVESAKEMNEKIGKLKKEVDLTEDPKEQEILKNDLASLEQCARLMGSKRYFHAFLALSCLPEMQRSMLPATSDFLDQYNVESSAMKATLSEFSPSAPQTPTEASSAVTGTASAMV